MNLDTLFDLDGRTALVTGGSRGIGNWIAAGLLSKGARVYITGRKVAECDQAAADLGPNCFSLPADVSTTEGRQALVAALGEREPKLDILVNNAATNWSAPFETYPEDAWNKVFALNLQAVFYLTQALYPMLKGAASKERPAKVINVASIDGIRLDDWETYAYQTSKAGVLHMTRRVAARLVKDHILMTAISPGPFGTVMNRVTRDRADGVGKNIPVGRVGNPEDMAGVAIYLASRAGNFVVGEAIAVDGGLAHAEMGHGLDDGVDYDYNASPRQ